MKPTPAFHRPALGLTAATGLALLLAAPGVLAQYKVVSPDGSVSYTDRPPITSNARILNIGRPGSAGTPIDIGLPPDLRTAVQRHPVTLYTSADCEPCDTGRRLLQQRGVPYAEKRVATDDDAAALERLVGGRTVPSLTIGAQPLRGLSQTDWSAFLDAAGYPRESKLPRGWQAAETTPLVEQRPAPRTPPAAAPARQAEPPVPAPAPGAIRF